MADRFIGGPGVPLDSFVLGRGGGGGGGGAIGDKQSGKL